MFATFCTQCGRRSGTGAMTVCCGCVAALWRTLWWIHDKKGWRNGRKRVRSCEEAKNVFMDHTQGTYKWFTAALTHMGGQTFGQPRFIYLFSHSQDVFLHTEQEAIGTNCIDKTQQYNIRWSEQQACLNGKCS